MENRKSSVILHRILDLNLVTQRLQENDWPFHHRKYVFWRLQQKKLNYGIDWAYKISPMWMVVLKTLPKKIQYAWDSWLSKAEVNLHLYRFKLLKELILGTAATILEAFVYKTFYKYLSANYHENFVASVEYMAEVEALLNKTRSEGVNLTYSPLILRLISRSFTEKPRIK